MEQILFIRSSFDGHLSSFYILAALNVDVQIPIGVRFRYGFNILLEAALYPRKHTSEGLKRT